MNTPPWLQHIPLRFQRMIIRLRYIILCMSCPSSMYNFKMLHAGFYNGVTILNKHVIEVLGFYHEKHYNHFT